MTSSNVQARSTSPNAPAEPTGWTGWVAFAAYLLMISGALSGIQGFLAVINHNWTMWNNNGAPYGHDHPRDNQPSSLFHQPT